MAQAKHRGCIVFLIVCFIALWGGFAWAEQQGQLKAGNDPGGIKHIWHRSLAMENVDIKTQDLTNRDVRQQVLAGTVRQFYKDAKADPVDSAFDFDLFTDQPWFRGWYTRITDEAAGRSIVVVGASQYLPGVSLSPDGSLPGYLAVIISEDGQTTIYEAFPQKTRFWSNRDQVLDDPQSSDWEEFEWTAPGYGTITNTSLSVKIDNQVKVHADFGERLPWSSTIPWLGPEGLVEFLPFVPLHWFVYSLGSDAPYSYSFQEGGQWTTELGFGAAHQETNWGTVFPPAWIWAEGITGGNTSQFALSGGELGLGSETLTTWLVGFHSPRVEWSFRQTIPGTVFVTTIDGCAGRFSITAADTFRKLVISANAPEESFVPVSVPTEVGFVEGAEESFSADVTVKAFLRLPWFGDVLIDARQFENSGLEFGGSYMCCQ